MSDMSRKRHIAKTFTWRAVGTLDTVLISWIVTGNPLTGMKIGLFEVVTKMVLYYLHERLWFRVQLVESQKRHILKTLSWRAIGTLDTIILSWIITGNPLTGLKIGSVEVITKMILYYLHERTWYNINYGLGDRRSKEERT
ncbi:DUF2061 domain-containing protein [Robiginitalea sp.]|uniref:DUF2061 domain-containing protein n=1 Tax=Robiginitalea sp. TaxID=1902411 RepID=UPI003C76B70A